MKKTPSFSQRLKAGWSKEQLMKYYALTEAQFEKILKNLAELHTTGALS